jgi:tRNA1Val (adenine37-N6)-methyltransferase
MDSPPFRCKKFLVNQQGAAHPVGTDSFLLGAWASVHGAENVLDIGTGTGIVALMVTQRIFEQGRPCRTHAVELDAPSAEAARRNFAASPWNDCLTAVQQSIQAFAAAYQGGGYDLIVSNPPYFNETIHAPGAARRQARSTVSLSFSDLLDAVALLLSPRGRFAFILPHAAGFQCCEMAATRGLYFNRLTEVWGKAGKTAPERLLVEMSRSTAFLEKSRLTIYGANGQYTEEYRALTAAFYLNN